MGFHFYTANPQEHDFVIANYGFKDEGILGYSFPMPGKYANPPFNVPGWAVPTAPLYRLFEPNLGDHFYTTSAEERDNAVAKFGYVSEGIACYVGRLPTIYDPQNFVTLLRMFNPKSGEHFYTTNGDEAQRVLAQEGFVAEDLSGGFEGDGVTVNFLLAKQFSATNPLFRLYCPGVPSPQMTIQPPQTPQPGVAGIAFYNCNSDRHEVNIWVLDVTSGSTWKQYRTLPSQYDDSGMCPGTGSTPFQISFQTGHTYEVVAVDPQGLTCGGQNDPTVIGCRRWATQVAGDANGSVVYVQIP